MSPIAAFTLGFGASGFVALDLDLA